MAHFQMWPFLQCASISSDHIDSVVAGTHLLVSISIVPTEQREASKETTHLQADYSQASTSQQKAQLWTTLLWPARYYSGDSLCSLTCLMITSTLTTKRTEKLLESFEENSYEETLWLHLVFVVKHTKHLMHFIFSPSHVPLGHSNKICLLNHIMTIKFKESFL